MQVQTDASMTSFPVSCKGTLQLFKFNIKQMLLSFFANSSASALIKKRMMAKRAFLLARAPHNYFVSSMNNFWMLKEANLLQVAKRFGAIERPQHWFDRLWANVEFETLDDYWKPEFRFSKQSFNDTVNIVAGEME